jgi:hypothetical protein
LTPGRQLLGGSLKDYFKKWRQWLMVTGIVVVPSALITIWAADTVTAAYMSLAAIIMNQALLYSVMNAGGGPVKLREAYYQGTARLVPFIMVVFVLALAFIPFITGVVFFFAGTADTTVAISAGEQVLLGLVFLILSLPTLFLSTRWILAIFTVQDKDVKPIQALKLSNRAVKGRSWSVLWRLVIISALAIGVMAVLRIAFSMVTVNEVLVDALLQLVTSIVVLPITYLYLYRLNRSLHGKG